MNSILTFLVTVLSLSACGKVCVDPAFTDYVARFEQLGGVSAKNVSVEFGDLVDNGYAGQCNGSTVTINENVWNSFSDYEKEELVFHELGHCVLHREHVNDRVSENGEFRPTSMMNWNMVPWGMYEGHRDAYLRELFNAN